MNLPVRYGRRRNSTFVQRIGKGETNGTLAAVDIPIDVDAVDSIHRTNKSWPKRTQHEEAVRQSVRSVRGREGEGARIHVSPDTMRPFVDEEKTRLQNRSFILSSDEQHLGGHAYTDLGMWLIGSCM